MLAPDPSEPHPPRGTPDRGEAPARPGGGARPPARGAALMGGRYQLQEEIGAGAFAVTYRALDRRLERSVAVKLLRPHVALDPAALRRFKREARAAAAVAHPNVLDVYDFGRHGDRLYLVMPYVAGMTLKDRLVRTGPLPPADAVRLAQQVLAGLAAIHRAGIIHRDVKPQNILLDPDGRARVADFGIAHLTGEPGVTTTGTTIGTAAYMAPEQGQGRPLGPATDLYAVGAVLYEMLTGRVPFEAPTAIATIYAHIQAPLIPPSQRRPGEGISPALDTVIMRAMAKAPADRFAAAEEMLRALAAAVPPTTLAPGGPPPARQRAPRHRGGAVAPRRWRRVAWALALLTLVLIGGGLVAAQVWPLHPDTARRGSRPPAQLAAQVPTVSATRLIAPTAGEQRLALVSARASTGPRATSWPAPTSAPSPTATPVPTPTATPAPTTPPTATAPIMPLAPAPTGTAGIEPRGAALAVPTPERTAAGGAAGAKAPRPLTVSFTASDWQGAYYQQTGNLQPWSALYAQSTGYGQGSVTFTLPSAPAAATFVLSLDGMTSENWTALPIAIRINGQEVYAANSPFPTWNGVDGQQPWTTLRFDLPTAALRPGTNTLTFVNLVGEGGFGLPPYILVADATLTVDLRGTS